MEVREVEIERGMGVEGGEAQGHCVSWSGREDCGCQGNSNLPPGLDITHNPLWLPVLVMLNEHTFRPLGMSQRRA